MRGGLRRLHVAARADARIGEALPSQFSERVAVDRPSLGLHVLLVPVEPQPAEVVQGLRRRARLVPRVVEVLHAHYKLPADGPRPQPRYHESARVAKVQRARRTRREPPDVPGPYRASQNFFHSATNSESFSSEPNAAAVAADMRCVLMRAAT